MGRYWGALCGLGMALSSFASTQPERIQMCQQVLQGVLEEHAFMVRRNLNDYADHFGGRFLRDLAALDGNSHILDAGCGEGIAITNYVDPSSSNISQAVSPLKKILSRPQSQRARVTGVTFSREGNQVKSQRSLLSDPLAKRRRILEGRLFRDISDREIGKVDMIWDYYGVLSYDERVDLSLEKYLRLLKSNGVIYVNTAPFRTQIRDKNKIVHDLDDWIKTIPGLKVETEGFGVIRIQKVGLGPAQIPRLKILEVAAGKPPTRVYDEVK